ncbi:MAG: nucleotide pyrophosphohydrolase [Erysipelotrichales bacterium]|jgi:NTP pyrophosphatase (non-canonical NTP hydrolase)|nr:nucleotide pyrophosphohydrolase [Bacilli bacterium]MEA4820816.1 nucleotide pyrophosphohydrolase [Erysipelotrichales bacterium]
MDDVIKRIVEFRDERNWKQFHTPANLAKSIAIEAGELLECFQWDDTTYNIEDVKDELADVMIYCLQMSDELNLNIKDIINNKMLKNEKKYPLSKSKNTSKKYDKL